MTWFSRHASAIEALAATVTALVAVGALIGVKLQIDETDRIQQAQSARESFRAHLALAATLPQFAEPADACALLTSDQGGAYRAFVDHLLYSAEQMLVIGDGWETTFLDQLAPHSDYICASAFPSGETSETASLLATFRRTQCPAALTCQNSPPN